MTIQPFILFHKERTPRKSYLFFLFALPVLFLLNNCSSNQNDSSVPTFEVIVLGEGTGATSAAIQSARSGAKTLWINPLEWPGGMLTSAGVSAIDGNHNMPAGLWGEFRRKLRAHYGGAAALSTGWVSHTLFEPKVGAQIWNELIEQEKNLTVYTNTTYAEISKDKYWQVSTQDGEIFQGEILIDGTDLGDVAEIVGADFDIGMDSKNDTGENMAPEKANSIIQDLTFVAILQDYGVDRVIPKPKGYDPTPFYCSCKSKYCEDEEAHPCDQMMTYAKLPNNKYMINWPKSGNDFYMDLEQGENLAQAIAKAKNKTLQFVYFIQTELGYSRLGLAADEFPTPDGLPLYPYHREGRRVKGAIQLNVNHILEPYNYNLFRTGIAVGDYPIDHHHGERSDAPEIDFPMVPSFAIPIGSLIPNGVEDFLIADKAISVTNIVNGSSRLQPVIIQIGQAAGLMAAHAAMNDIPLNDLDIRSLQDEILTYNGYLLPFFDVNPDDPHFISIQKIGATGILKGKGVPYKWANQTWFYPDTLLNPNELVEGLEQFDASLKVELGQNSDTLSIQNALELLGSVQGQLGLTQNDIQNDLSLSWERVLQLNDFNLSRGITKREMAVLLDRLIDPFNFKGVAIDGAFLAKKN